MTKFCINYKDIAFMSKHTLKLPFELNSASGGSKQPPIDRPTGADWDQFIWVKKGVGTFAVRDTEFELNEGKGIFMKHDVPCYYYGSELQTAWISFFTTDELFTQTIGDREYVLFDVPSYLQHETEELTALAKANTTTLKLSAAGYSLVASLFSDITTQSDKLVDRIKAILYERFSEPLTLDIIANEIGLDRFSLCRKLKDESGTSVMKELCLVRISKAKRMLRYTSEPIEVIGKQVGFDSHSYFTKRFRELCGCTPKEYRCLYIGK